jgi:hypothetical protein
MTEVLVRFTERVKVDGDASYAAQACGGIAPDGLWDGWIEFIGDSGTAIRTPRETKQPNRAALVYWAEGLTAAYLQGALNRALKPVVEHEAREAAAVPSIFSGPAERVVTGARPSHPVLDPFATYAQGESVLRQQLSALSRSHLQVIVDAYSLPIDESHSVTDHELVDEIVSCVRRLATR